MELWTEYEGRTIDGAFLLTKLLEPEGRSAFFLTPNGSGKPTVIRLIESHFDDDVILSRWRGIAALDHPNLVKLKKFGKVEMDGAPLAYAVMEPADGNLGEIIAERRLSVEETREVAESLVSALAALHDSGFVHEHVAPGNVLAVGDVIKLRSDCIRETPEGAEGQALKRRDVRDLAAVLLRSLTGRRTLEEARGELPLAAPFDGIVRNGLNGSWSLREIAAALAPAALPEIAAQSAAPAVASPVAEIDEEPEVVRPSPVSTTVDDLDETTYGPGMGVKILLGLSVLVLALIAWWMFHSKPVEKANEPTLANLVSEGKLAHSPAVVSSTNESKPSADAATTAGNASALRTASAPAPVAASTSLNGATHVEWRVIAFTYNHEDQAQTKVERLAARHPELKPEVFSPNGRAPYLVSIGGAMERRDAYELASKARNEGLASDVYAQNFHVAGPAQ